MSTNTTTRKSGQKLRNNRLNPYSSHTRRQLKHPRKKTKRKETEEERHKDEYVEEDAEETENPLPRSRLSLPNYEIAKSGPLLAHTESAPGRLAAKVPGIADFARKPSFTQHNEFESKFFKNNAKQLLHLCTFKTPILEIHFLRIFTGFVMWDIFFFPIISTFYDVLIIPYWDMFYCVCYIFFQIIVF